MVRYVRVSQNEFASVRKLYESVMSYACHGLFFREGVALADEIVHEIEAGEDLLSTARKMLISRGWVEDIMFTETGARVRGCLDAAPGAASHAAERRRARDEGDPNPHLRGGSPRARRARRTPEA